jgi:hypothetical protein
MNVDTFLKIGDSHKVCEDFILSGEVEGIQFIILSDGCSSSKDTDMGSRILCHITKKYLLDRFKKTTEMPTASFLGFNVIHPAKLAAQMFELPPTCLDATLVVGIYEPLGKEIYVYAYGDMALAMETKDHKLKIIDIEYVSDIEGASNAPYYLSYQLDEKRDENYHNMKVDKIIRTRVSPIMDFPKITIDDGCSVAYDYVQPMIFDANELKNILICSDGFSSFIEPGENGTVKSNPAIIANEFLSFKNIRGEFLKRRAKRALKELEQIHKASHYDDLSIGAFTFLED